MIHKRFCLLVLIFLFSASVFAQIPYQIKWIGLKDKKILELLKQNSELVDLQKRPPRSVNALRYRADSDQERMLKILQAFGYFDAIINFDLEKEKGIIVYVFIDAGPRYLLKSYEMFSEPCEDKKKIKAFSKIPLEKIGIHLNEPYIAEKIASSRLLLLNELSLLGYPLAKIQDLDVIVDSERKTVDTKVCISPGPLSKFGKTTILGEKNVNPNFIKGKIQYKEGEIYSEDKIKETRQRLQQTNLFTSVRISCSEEVDANNELPITIQLAEAKHKNISVGFSFATIDGFGVNFGWVNRNIRKMGEILSFKAEVAQKTYLGKITYIKPDFGRINQNFVTQGYARRQDISPYLSFTYGAIARIDRQVSKRFYYSIGSKMEYINVRQSANNGRFLLVGIPQYLKYTTTKSLLDPTSGITIILQTTPYQNLIHDQSFFWKNKLTTNLYIPLTKKEKLVFAFRLQLGSVAGASLTQVPLTKLFLGGSDDDLRGYKYRTVSPRDQEGDPLGGRSAIYWTFEPRIRLTETIGIVPFTDWGNVRKTTYPTLKGKWHKSVGIGLRYFTFFGPLRLDVGFPLNRRDQDPKYRIYASIGQTF